MYLMIDSIGVTIAVILGTLHYGSVPVLSQTEQFDPQSF